MSPEALSPSTVSSAAERPGARPFLKWAGGKRQLLHEIRRYYPSSFNRYWEPFVGSGAVFFDLQAEGRLDGRVSFLIDSNADLIACYESIRDDVDGVISSLGGLERRHQRNALKTYYDVRRRFNAERLALLAQPRRVETSVELAAMFIYLNRTGFNGLFRLNGRGSFNVPMGRYANPQICDDDNLRRVSTLLREQGVTLHHGDYAMVEKNGASGDFVYLDPPYAPLSQTANFRSYTAEGFSSADQRRLQQIVIGLARRGCAVLLSNSSAPEIEQLYEHNTEARRAGLRVLRVKARRAINSKASSRGAVDEFLVTNL